MGRCFRGVWVALFVALAAGGSHAATLEQDIASSLDQLRAVRADQDPKAVAQYNRQMDAAWHLFTENKAQALPILRTQLKAELARAKPSDLVLLDVGFFLYGNDAAEGKGIARDALSRIDLQAPIIKANDKELFEFLHLLAEDHDALILPLIERTFLVWDSPIFIPQHALKLDGTLICVFLYGAYGPESEVVLRTKLADQALTKRVLEILGWIGSPAALPEVRQVMTSATDYDTFTRSASYMMRAGGPGGRSVMRAVDPERLDDQSKQYFFEVREEIEGMSFESIKAHLAGLTTDQKLSDTEISVRLDTMIQDYGKNEHTSPLSVLNSGLSAEALIAKLTSIRTRTFFRLSDEALDDVQVTNLLINTLRYRGK